MNRNARFFTLFALFIFLLSCTVPVCAADREVFETPCYDALIQQDPNAESADIAAAILNDYENYSKAQFPVLCVTYLKYEYNNEESVLLYYCLSDPPRTLDVFINSGLSGGKTDAQISPVDIKSSAWNEATAKQTYQQVVQIYGKTAGISVIDSGLIEANTLKQRRTELTASDDQSPENDSADETGFVGQWYNIKGSDVYTFDADGSGTHDSIPILWSSTATGVSVLENITDITPNTLTVDQAAGFTRLIPVDLSTYYVRKKDYDRLSSASREQTVKILTSVEFWSAKAAINYLQFFEGGGGWFLVEGETDPLTWEFVDNDTIKLSVDTSVGARTLVVNVTNNNGTYQLTDDDGNVKYTPKK